MKLGKELFPNDSNYLYRYLLSSYTTKIITGEDKMILQFYNF